MSLDPGFDPNDHSDFGGGAPGLADLGTPTEGTPQIVEYWGTNITDRWFFPDKVQFIEFKKLNEGERVRYQKKTNRDITVVKQTGDAKMNIDQSTERHALIGEAVVGWNLYRGGVLIPFGKGTPGSIFEQWLNSADPSLVNGLEKAIRKLNPWMSPELTTTEIDEMIEDLSKQRLEAEKREAGN